MTAPKFDFDDFRKQLTTAHVNLRSSAFIGLDAASRLLEKTLNENAPVDSGVTKSTIKRLKVRKGKRNYNQGISIGSGDPRKIIGFIELGTKDEDPQPFIRHSADLVEHKMIRIIENEISEI